MDITESMKMIEKKIEKLGFSKTKVAKDLGVSSVSVCSWIRGTKEPSLYHFFELVEYLNMEIEIK